MKEHFLEEVHKINLKVFSIYNKALADFQKLISKINRTFFLFFIFAIFLIIVSTTNVMRSPKLILGLTLLSCMVLMSVGLGLIDESINKAEFCVKGYEFLEEKAIDFGPNGAVLETSTALKGENGVKSGAQKVDPNDLLGIKNGGNGNIGENGGARADIRSGNRAPGGFSKILKNWNIFYGETPFQQFDSAELEEWTDICLKPSDSGDVAYLINDPKKREIFLSGINLLKASEDSSMVLGDLNRDQEFKKLISSFNSLKNRLHSFEADVGSPWNKFDKGHSDSALKTLNGLIKDCSGQIYAKTQSECQKIMSSDPENTANCRTILGFAEEVLKAEVHDLDTLSDHDLFRSVRNLVNADKEWKGCDQKTLRLSAELLANLIGCIEKPKHYASQMLKRLVVIERRIQELAGRVREFKSLKFQLPGQGQDKKGKGEGKGSGRSATKFTEIFNCKPLRKIAIESFGHYCYDDFSIKFMFWLGIFFILWSMALGFIAFVRVLDFIKEFVGDGSGRYAKVRGELG